MKPAQARREHRQAIRAEAERWLVRLKDPDATGKDRAAFGAWRLRAAEHAEAYGDAEALWERTGEFLDALQDDPEVSAVLAEARAPVAERGRRTRGWARAAAVAALVLGVAGAAWMVNRSATSAPEPRLLATAIGERRTVALDDGSQVTLDAATRVEILYARDARTARLVDGRARFTVAPDRRRPFTVEAGEGSATVLGTIFDVSHLQEEVTVTVLEGEVEVAGDRDDPGSERARLRAGQRIAYVAGAGLSSSEAVDPVAASAWSEGRLVFDDAPLAEAVAELNRYRSKPIRFADPALADLELRGTFNADDPAAFLEAVTFLFPVRATEGESAILLTRDPGGEYGSESADSF